MALTLGMILAFVGYSMATLLSARTIFNQFPLSPKPLFLAAFTAIIAQLFATKEALYVTGELHLSIAAMCLLISALISSVLTIRSLKQLNLMILVVGYGFSAILTLILFMVPESSLAYKGGMMATSLPTTIHIILSMAAYCVLIIASLYALQFRYINTKLKAKTLSLHSHLPPLNAVEAQQFRLLAIGVGLLSLALITGFLYLDNLWSSHYAHKTVLSIVAWAVFTVITIGHKIYGWRGTKSAVGTIIAAFILTLAYFGSRFVREILLN
jgi:ABC-type uncharacterized transport system permease subunit